MKLRSCNAPVCVHGFNLNIKGVSAGDHAANCDVLLPSGVWFGHNTYRRFRFDDIPKGILEGPFPLPSQDA